MVTANIPEERSPWSSREVEIAQGDADLRSDDTPSAPIRLGLREMFEQNYASVWRILRRFGVVASQLDDATQEVFWVVARRIDDIRSGSERAFLYGIALRVASNEVRRRKSAPAMADPDEILRLADPRPSAEERLEQHRARELLDEVLDRLPLDLRTVFVLAELEGMEVRQIAELEGIPVGTASSRLRRAREEFSAIAKRVRTRLTARGARP